MCVVLRRPRRRHSAMRVTCLPHSKYVAPTAMRQVRSQDGGHPDSMCQNVLPLALGLPCCEKRPGQIVKANKKQRDKRSETASAPIFSGAVTLSMEPLRKLATNKPFIMARHLPENDSREHLIVRSLWKCPPLHSEVPLSEADKTPTTSVPKPWLCSRIAGHHQMQRTREKLRGGERDEKSALVEKHACRTQQLQDPSFSHDQHVCWDCTPHQIPMQQFFSTVWKVMALRYSSTVKTRALSKRSNVNDALAVHHASW